MVPIQRNDYLDKCIRAIGNGMIKVVTGVGRSGKSYLLSGLLKQYLLRNGYNENQIIELSLDSSKNSKYTNPIELEKYICSILPKDRKCFLFIDEIQECKPIPNPVFENRNLPRKEIPLLTFHGVLNEILTDFPNVDCYVTGSNSKMLSKDVITEFRGRGWEIRVYPLSFKEVYEYRGGDKETTFKEYLRYGGMPYTLHLDDKKDKGAYLDNLFQETYFKDVIEHHHIKSSKLLKDLTQLLASTSGSLTSVTNLSRLFSSKFENKTISRESIGKYIEGLEDSFLVQEVKRFDIRGKKIIEGLKKYYFVDTGLRNSCLNFSQNDYGFLVESIIYYELRRLGFHVDIGIVDLFRTDKKTKERKHIDYEVDFVAQLGDRRYYLQSAYEINSYEKLEQESLSLLNIPDTFSKIMIESNNYPATYDERGVLHVGIIDFLFNASEFLPV